MFCLWIDPGDDGWGFGKIQSADKDFTEPPVMPEEIGPIVKPMTLQEVRIIPFGTALEVEQRSANIIRRKGGRLDHDQ